MPRAGKRLGALLACLAAPAAAAPCAGTVHLTFDTGNMGQAEEIARVLKEENVRATFFLANEPTRRGDHALDAAWGDYWRARVAEGHVFGNHTWSHFYQRHDTGDGKLVAVTERGAPRTLDRGAFCRELAQVAGAFHALTGASLSGLWRAPGGRVTQQSLRWAASCGYPVHVGWSEAGYLQDDVPAERMADDTLVRRAVEGAAPGDVLLMHLGTWSRPDAGRLLRPVIHGLKARGFCFSPLAAASR